LQVASLAKKINEYFKIGTIVTIKWDIPD